MISEVTEQRGDKQRTFKAVAIDCHDYSASRELRGNLCAASRNDIAAFDIRTAYDYLRRQIEEE